MTLHFAGLELDPARRELRRGGSVIAMEPQAFDVLVYLANHRDRVVAKEELMDEVWGGRFVSETAVTSRIKQIRRALGDDGREQTMIKTSHGRGYRFVAEVIEPAAAAATVEADFEPPPVRYTTSDGLSIAYQVTGSGDRDIVLVAGFISHLEQDWGYPGHDRLLHRLAGMGRLIRFDKRGTGMSDRPPGVPDLETRMHDVVAVMDAVGSERATLIGYSEGGPMSVLFAAAYPERVSELVLIASYAKRTWVPDYPWAQPPAQREEYTEQLMASWDWAADLRFRMPSADAEAARWWSKRCRSAATPSTVRALMDMNALVDIRAALPAVKVPTLVVHRVGDDVVTVGNGRYLADHIPGSRYVELAGDDHLVAADPDQLLDPVEDFLSTMPVESAAPPMALAAIIAVDGPDTERIVTGLTGAGGRRRQLSDGRPLMLFDGPATAVRALSPLIGSADASASLMIAEVPRDGSVIRGFAAETTDALARLAPTGGLWTSATGRDLLAGSGITVEPAGTHEVGPAGSLALFSVLG